MPRTDRAARVVNAPADRVFDALVDRDALLAWLPPRDMTAEFERFDPRPGGSYRLVLTYADAAGSPGKSSAGSDIVEARYVDIVPDVRVVQAVDFVADDPEYAGTMTIRYLRISRKWPLTCGSGGPDGERACRRDFVSPRPPTAAADRIVAVTCGNGFHQLLSYVVASQ